MPLANIIGMKGWLRQNNVLVVFSNLSENVLYMPEEHSTVTKPNMTLHFLYIYIFLYLEK